MPEETTGVSISVDEIQRRAAELESFKNPVPPAQDLGKEAFLKLLTVTCLGIVDTPRGSIFCRYRRCVYERSRNFTSGKAV